jgi:hypothetical protein
MPTELAECLRGLDRKLFDVGDGVVTCWFGPKDASRNHAVRLRESDREIRLEATIATAKTLEEMSDDPYRWAWRRNRASMLVGFRVDRQNRLVAEAVAPKIGLTQDEFVTYLHAVASEADRMELILTGRDIQ